jgi:hypothetical protein
VSSTYAKHLFAKIILLVIVWSPAYAAENAAPLGLTWGASVDETRAIGVDLQSLPNKDGGDTYVAQKLPKALSDQDGALLSFGFDNKLWRIVAISRPFSNDPQGTAVKARYQELLTSLTEKYGKPRSVHSLGDSIFSQPAYFVAGLRGGNSFWYSNFDGAEMKVQIGIQGETNDTARWRIHYENKGLLRSFEESKRLKENGSL